jgi:hypothetical protein
MGLGLAAAIVAALAYGLASVLQARAAGDEGPADGKPTLRSTIATMLALPFLLGIALDVLGFAGNLIADRKLPLFLAQPIVAASLIVTAVAAGVFLRVVLSRRDELAIVTVVVALVVLSFVAGQEGDLGSGWAGAHHAVMHGGVLVAAGVLIVGGLVLLKASTGPMVAAAAGLTAGALFGVMATSVRIVDGVDPFELRQLLTDPAASAVVVAGVGGFYLFTVALQAGSVNAAAAALVVGETVIPGAVGLTLLGDQIRAGWAPVAVLAFILAVAGAATIAMGQVGELG